MSAPVSFIFHDTPKGRVAEAIGDGILLAGAAQARDLMIAGRADWIAVHVRNIAPEFFDLRSGIAGEVLQKFVNYRARLAIVGDISRYTKKSESLKALVRESNRGHDVRFVATLASLLA